MQMNANLCLCGDFNAIWSKEEWKTRGGGSQQDDIDHFNLFIEDNSLSNIPLRCQSFT